MVLLAAATGLAGAASVAASPGTLTVTLNLPDVAVDAHVHGVVMDAASLHIEATAIAVTGPQAVLSFAAFDEVGRPTGPPALLAGGDHLLVLRGATTGDWFADGDPGWIGTISIDGDTALTWSTADLDVLVETNITVNSQLSDGARLHTYWQYPGASPVTSIVSDPRAAPGLLFGSQAGFVDGHATVADVAVTAGTYDVSLLVDTDADGSIGSGDYRFQVRNVAVSAGVATDLSSQLAAQAPLP